MTAAGVRSGSIEAFDDAALVPLDEWDALLGRDDFYLSARWLRIAQAEAGVPMRYLMLRRAGAPVAGLATATVDASAPWLLGRPDTLLAHAADEGLPGAAECRLRLATDPRPVLLPGLVCGGRHLADTTVPRADGATRDDVDRLVAAAERDAAERGLRSVSFLYVDETDTALREVLDARGYLSFESAQSCRLELPAGGYDGYLRWLPKRRRACVLAERRAIAAAGVRSSVEPLTAGMLPRLGQLEAQLFAKYGRHGWLPDMSQRFLARVLDAFGAGALVSLAHAGGEIRGFALLLRLRDQWFAHRVGFDYPFREPRKLPVYYEVLFYAPAEHAGAAGITAIHYGIGSAEAKRFRGCTASAQRAHVLPLGGP